MFDYAYSAEALRRFNECSVKEHSSVRLWMELADAIGPMLLPFVVKTEAYSAIPFSAMGIKPTPLSTLLPRRGEMWILFCFRDGALGKSDTPIRDDGFALILEWRKGRLDSPLLSSAIHGLADSVRKQLSITGWSIHPSFDRYGDRVSFTDAELFSDAQHADNVASAWGALAAGLYCVQEGRYPSQWPFPSLQWDTRRGGVAGVAGLNRKLSVALDCGATSLVVEHSQVAELSDCLKRIHANSSGKVFVYGVPHCTDTRKTVERIAFGVERKRRRNCSIVVATASAALLVAAAFYWQHHAAVVAQAREHLLSSIGKLSLPDGVGIAREKATSLAWGELGQSFQLSEARTVFLKQLVSRNWLVPVEILDSSASAGRYYPTPMHSELNNRGFRMFWFPCHFADKIMFWLNTDESLSAELYGKRLWYRTGREWCGAETFRAAPSGLAAIAEVAFPERRLVAIDPFSGSDLWTSAIDSRITAFCFSNDGTRFAFVTEGGFVRVWNLRNGRPVTEVASLKEDATSICFSDDDANLWARTAKREICYAIVVQLAERPVATEIADEWAEDDCKDALSFLTSPTTAGLLVGERGPLATRIFEYAATAPSNRTVNVLSSIPARERVDKLCKTIDGRKEVRAFWPTHRQAFFESWEEEVNGVVLHNFRVDYDYGAKTCSLKEGMQRLFYAFDRQALELEGNFIRFASKNYPGDPWVKKRLLLYECWTRRDCKDCSPTSFNDAQHALPQAEDVNRKERDDWVAECRQRSVEMRTQEQSLLKTAKKGSSQLVNEAYDILSTMPRTAVASLESVGEFNAKGKTMLALAALSAAERCSDGDPAPWSTPLRKYLLKGAAAKASNFFVIMGFKDGQTSTNDEIRIGDLIVSVEEPHPKKYLFKILRFDKAIDDFREFCITQSEEQFDNWKLSRMIKGFHQECHDNGNAQSSILRRR